MYVRKSGLYRRVCAQGRLKASLENGCLAKKVVYRQELLQDRLRPSSESGCIFKGDVASKEEFLFGEKGSWGGLERKWIIGKKIC